MLVIFACLQAIIFYNPFKSLIYNKIASYDTHLNSLYLYIACNISFFILLNKIITMSLFHIRQNDSGSPPPPGAPPSPALILQHAFDMINSKRWEFHLAFGIGGSLSGAMALYLVIVYFWRPKLVNRVSLRLIFAILLYDFIVSIIQGAAKANGPGVGCRLIIFFSQFFGYASVYTSTSIAVNLYMKLLRKRSKPLPKYTEVLYFVVPLAVALLHWLPPIIYAASKGYCTAGDLIEPASKAYILYMTFVYLFLPLVAILFNLVISTIVIITLLIQQRQIGMSLREIADNKELEVNLLVTRKFNSAAIRIALYPLAPIGWWVMNAVYYAVMYPVTMTKPEDAYTWVFGMNLAWFSLPAVIFTNFMVFVTDPAFLKVVKEVRTILIANQRKKKKQQSAMDDMFYGLDVKSQTSSKDTCYEDTNYNELIRRHSTRDSDANIAYSQI